jgi:hypothetical protein
MPKYAVTINFYGTADFEIEAESEDEAIEKVRNGDLMDYDDWEYNFGDDATCKECEEDED